VNYLFGWWRIAAAAVLLLGISITVAVFVNKKPFVQGGIVKGSGDPKKTNREDAVITPVKKENTPAREVVGG
jgi:hypothetical protein